MIDRRTGKEAGSFPGPRQPTRPLLLTVSDDGNSVLLHASIENLKKKGDFINQLEVWSVREHKLRMTRMATGDDLNTEPRLSPDSRRIAISSITTARKRSDKLELWEIASNTKEVEFRTDGAVLTKIAWSPSGRVVAGGDEIGRIWLWNILDGVAIKCLDGHRCEVIDLLFSQDGRRLISSSADTTVLVWDMQSLIHRDNPESQSSPVNDLWSALESSEAAKAHTAMRSLIYTPDVALPLLRQRLIPHLSDPERVNSLLAQLDDNNFHVRNQAREQLAKMGADVESVLREALTKNPSVEVRENIKRILEKSLAERRLQIYRGVEVLEKTGSTKARQALEELSQLPEGLLQADEAKAALQRLEKPKPCSAP